MKLDEKEDYGQNDPYFQNNSQDRDDDIDAPPFDNSFSTEEEDQKSDLSNQVNNPSNQEFNVSDDNLEEDEDEEDLENEDSMEEKRNEHTKDDQSRNERSYRGL